MANGKTHLVTGVGMALAADYFWQRERMATDPGTRFDCGEMVFVGFWGGVAAVLADVLEPATSPHHRGFFHSVCFLLIVLLALATCSGTLTVKWQRFIGILAGCYFSHLFLDAITPRGLPWIGLASLVRFWK
jgi:membrane-bound metal-dependent hydrolase YbcI (DUF457 family)